METQLRVVFLIVGLLILLGVAVDIFRRRPAKQNVGAGFSNDSDSSDLLRAIMTRRQQTVRNTDYQHQADMDDEVELEQVHIEPYLESYIETEDQYLLDPDYDSAILNTDPDLDTNLGSDLESNLEIHAAPAAEMINPNSIVVIYIMARNPAGFMGNDLKTALANAHMHIDAQNIYYRSEKEDGSGDKLFSLAKAVEPGYFDVDYLHQQQVPGVTLFMRADKMQNPILALDRMIRAAKQIAFVLNGELLDHSRQALTLMTIDQYKAQIQALT